LVEPAPICSKEVGKFQFINFCYTELHVRKTVLGAYVDGFALLTPDDHDVWNWVICFRNRLLLDMPPLNKQVYRKYVRSAHRTLDRLFGHLYGMTPWSFKEWLDHSHYNQAEKKDLSDILDNFYGLPWFKCKPSKHDTFMKNEDYLEPKAPRSINPPHKLTKGRYGPLVATVEAVVYLCTQCMKSLQPELKVERLAYMGAFFAFWFSNDYSKFEASYHSLLYWDLECWILTRFLPECKKMLRQYAFICSGVQGCCNPDRTVGITVEGRRMSGEMTTAFTHFLYNLTLNQFVAEESGLRCLGAYEGDDSVVAFSGKPDFSVMEKLGVKVKVSPVDLIHMASFCHIVFQPESHHRVRDPRELLVKLGFTNSKFMLCKKSNIRMGLLKGKCLSYLYELPCCPIIAPLFFWLVSLLSGIDPIIEVDGYRNKSYRQNVLSNVPRVNIQLVDRYFVQDCYGVSVEMQLECEKSIVCISDPRDPLPSVFADVVATHPNSKFWMDYWDRAVH